MADDYVEVRDEPRHRRRFEDDLVRVYDVLVPPGDTTLFHHHTEDTFYVAVQDARISDQTFGAEEANEAEVPTGLSICRGHRKRPLIHRVTNVGSADMRMIGAEIKDTPLLTSAEPLSAPGHSLTLERDRLRAYDLQLDAGATTGTINYRFASLTIFLTTASARITQADGRFETTIHAPGDVVWRPDALELAIENVGEEPFRAVVGEWR